MDKELVVRIKSTGKFIQNHDNISRPGIVSCARLLKKSRAHETRPGHRYTIYGSISMARHDSVVSMSIDNSTIDI